MTETAAAVIGLVTFALILTFYAIGRAMGRHDEHRREIAEWEDIHRAWDDVAAGTVLAERDMPDPPLLAQSDGFDDSDWARVVEPIEQLARDRPITATRIPCTWHGSHGPEDPCDPPTDTDYLATSGILFHVKQLEQLIEFEQWLASKGVRP